MRSSTEKTECILWVDSQTGKRRLCPRSVDRKSLLPFCGKHTNETVRPIHAEPDCECVERWKLSRKAIEEERIRQEERKHMKPSRPKAPEKAPLPPLPPKADNPFEIEEGSSEDFEEWLKIE